MSVTRARQTRVAFSNPYMRIGQMALVRAEEKYRYAPLGISLANQRIGIKKGTTADLLVQQEFPKAKRKYYDEGDQASKALLAKKIDLYISDSVMVWYLAGKYEASGLTPAPMVLTEESLAWGMRRSDTELQQAVNLALEEMMSSGELNRLLRKWVPRLE
jgi:polar amino acid transport system substrate-binding protein